MQISAKQIIGRLYLSA